MFDVTYWLLFFTAALAINISPGPDLIYILSQTVGHGRKFGFCSSLGVGSGALVHISLVALGLAAILKASLLAFTIVKIAGAVYLVYLGVTSIIAKGFNFNLSTSLPQKGLSGWDAYRQGILVDLLNPKAIIFFMAFLPQFVRPHQGTFAGQIVLLGLLVVLLGLVVEGIVIVLTSKVAEILNRKTGLARWMEKISGVVLIGLGIKLALASYRE